MIYTVLLSAEYHWVISFPRSWDVMRCVNFAGKRMEGMLKNYISIRKSVLIIMIAWWSKKPITSPTYVKADLAYGKGTLKVRYRI